MLGILNIITEHTGTNSDASNLKTKSFLENFYSILRIYIKFRKFWKKS